jgi:AbrB family transcriptional regulator (stage V sporulation protein T)
MKATGIVKRIDDVGRVAIPKEIRRTLRIREGDPLEIFTEGNMVCFKKYETDEEEFAQKCAKWVQEAKNYILSVNFMDNTTYVMFMHCGAVKNVSVKFNTRDKFDMNVAICYAAEKCGFRMFDGFR